MPTAEHEALRDLVRARAAAKKDETRAKHRVVKHLLRNGLRQTQECGVDAVGLDGAPLGHLRSGGKGDGI